MKMMERKAYTAFGETGRHRCKSCLAEICRIMEINNGNINYDAIRNYEGISFVHVHESQIIVESKRKKV